MTILRPQRVRMRDVAKAAGVSQTTASFVLSERGSSAIPLKTQEHVRRVAREMGYEPNLLARSLGRQKTDTIGLMISELENPFFVNILKNVEKQVFEAGYQVLLEANSHGYGRYQPLHKISGWLVDGVLIWTTPSRSLALYLGERAKHIPTVYLGHLRDDGSDAVAMDLNEAGRLAADHILSRGHRRIGFVSTYAAEFILWPNNQIPAVKDVCRAAGVDPEFIVIDPDDVQQAAFEAGAAIAARPPSARPDAVICHNDWIALFFYQGLRSGGLRVPDDIALMGFDGIKEARLLPCGPLTTVRMPGELLCGKALDILLQRMGGDSTTPAHQVLVAPELVIGKTT
jgi:LacI family transcriptional regulator